MTQKKRIYDLAKEYGLSGDDLVKKIKDRGTFSSVKGKMSSLDDFEVLQIQGLGGTQDFIGINYYGRFYIKSNILAPTKFEVKNHDEQNPNEIKNELGWADFPLGMKNILLSAKSKYNLPIYILESGTAQKATDDKLRQQLIVTHLAEAAAAIKDGADVRGYFHWSLIDNFEWAEGYEARFGLVETDYKNGFARKKRKSYDHYKKIIETGISPETYKDAAKAY